MVQNPGKTVNFNNAMTDMSPGDAGAVVQSYDFSRFEHIVDVAGGHGTLLAAILDQAPRLRGTLFDMPHVIEGAKKAGILERSATDAPWKQAASFNPFRPLTPRS